MPISLYHKKIRNNTIIKSIIQPHGYLEPFRLNISKYKKNSIESFEKSNLEGANILLACSESEGYKLKEMFPNKDIAIIHNGISDDFFNEPSLKYKGERKKKNVISFSNHSY